MNEKDPKRLKIRRVVLTVLCAVLGIVLVATAGVTVYAGHLLNRVNYVPADTAPTSQNEMDTVQTQTEPPLPVFTAPVLDFADVDFGTGPQLDVGGGEIINILLVGRDTASEEGARSDAMILCTFNKTKNTITMTSFLRDLYVKIPGYKKNRINAAYSFGGIGLLNETLNQNFGVEIDGNVQVDFAHFKKIIDLLGGVTLDLTEAEVKFIKKYYPQSELAAGTNLLSGKEALMYARNRHDVDGDFSRTNRQRKVLNALIGQCREKKLTEVLGLLNDVLPMVTTDISKTDLTAYAVTLFPMIRDAQITTQSIPVAGGYYNATINEMCVLVPDLEKNRQALAETLS